MNRNIYYMLAISIAIGVILIIFGTSSNIASLVTIGVTVLSGSIVGTIVSYSQSAIGAALSENLRIRNEHLEDFKKIFTSKPTNTIEGLTEYYCNKRNKFTTEKLLIDDIENHWKEFHSKFQNLVRKNDVLNNSKTTLSQKREGWIYSVSEESIKSFTQLLSADNSVVNEFFQSPVDLKDINFDFWSSGSKAYSTSISKLQNKISRILNQIIENEPKESNKIEQEFLNRISKDLTDDGEALKTSISTHNVRGDKLPFAVDLWNNLLSTCRDFFGNIHPYTRYHSIYGAIYELNSTPSNYFKHLVDDLPKIVTSLFGANEELKRLIISISEKELEIKSIKTGLEEQLSMIRTCHTLPGKCAWTKQS